MIQQHFDDRLVGHAGITGCSDHVGYSFLEIVMCHAWVPAWRHWGKDRAKCQDNSGSVYLTGRRLVTRCSDFRNGLSTKIHACVERSILSSIPICADPAGCAEMIIPLIGSYEVCLPPHGWSDR